MISIRKAQVTDIEALLPLLEQLGYPSTKEELEKRFIHFLNKDGYGVAVACLNNKIVGFVAFSKSELFVSDMTRIHIEGITVDKSIRGQNIGKQLMEFVEKYAQRFSPAVIDLTSGLRRASEGTHEFYKKLGYKNEGLMAKLYLRKNC
ncbi:MAG: GNAT family N-acetyltransferase [Rickettsiales bacterium]|jgi:ribosomal protein S18 acetylase RimI-like enzyme|nr:GNAT family N-acetyltransferase [Rickettsiales bacterium]